MKIRKIASILMVVGLLLMLINPINNITGFVISPSNRINNSLFVLGLIFFLVSLILLTTRKSLDAIIILGKPNKDLAYERTEKAVEVYKKRGADIIIASGGDTSQPSEYKHEAHMIYEALREKGIKPTKIRIESHAQDTLENILYSLKKTKGKEIGFVGSPGHLDRVEYLVREAKKEGLLNKEIHVHRIETDESWKEKIYEKMALIFTQYKLRTGSLQKSKKKLVGSKFAEKLKTKIINYFFYGKKKTRKS